MFYFITNPNTHEFITERGCSAFKPEFVIYKNNYCISCNVTAGPLEFREAPFTIYGVKYLPTHTYICKRCGKVTDKSHIPISYRQQREYLNEIYGDNSGGSYSIEWKTIINSGFYDGFVDKIAEYLNKYATENYSKSSVKRSFPWKYAVCGAICAIIGGIYWRLRLNI